MKWTHSENLRLISLVKRQPCLYDITRPSFTLWKKVRIIWESIGRQMQRSARDVRSKWHQICYIYVWLNKTNYDPDRKDCWPYFDAMSFVRPYVPHFRMVLNSNREDVIDTEATIAAGVPVPVLHYTARRSFKMERRLTESRRGSKFYKPSPSKRKFPHILAAEARTKTVEIVHKKLWNLVFGEGETINKPFLETVLPHLSLLTPLKQLMFRMEVFDLLVENLKII